jgi:hypothetical protein
MFYVDVERDMIIDGRCRLMCELFLRLNSFIVYKDRLGWEKGGKQGWCLGDLVTLLCANLCGNEDVGRVGLEVAMMCVLVKGVMSYGDYEGCVEAVSGGGEAEIFWKYIAGGPQPRILSIIVFEVCSALLSSPYLYGRLVFLSSVKPRRRSPVITILRVQ